MTSLLVRVENEPSHAAKAILNGQRSVRAGSAGALGMYAYGLAIQRKCDVDS